MQLTNDLLTKRKYFHSTNKQQQSRTNRPRLVQSTHKMTRIGKNKSNDEITESNACSR